MISRVVLVLFILSISLASHAVSNCDWPLLSEEIKSDYTELLQGIESSWLDDLNAFREIKDKDEQASYLKAKAKSVQSEILTRAKRPALHFNLHGGGWLHYVQNGGIRAGRGDAGVAMGMSNDNRYKVYFFNLAEADLYEALTAKNPMYMFLRARYGDTAVLFDLDAPEITEQRKSGNIESENAITLNYSENNRGTFRGVPVSSFITYPLQIFSRAYRSMGSWRLSYNERTLFALVMIEQSMNRPWSW